MLSNFSLLCDTSQTLKWYYNFFYDPFTKLNDNTHESAQGLPGGCAKYTEYFNTFVMSFDSPYEVIRNFVSSSMRVV